MRSLGQYILSIGLASLLVAILDEFSDRKSSIGALIRMVCGLFLAFTVINPITELNFDILDAFSENLSPDATLAVSTGTALAEESMEQIIKQEAEAYILDKAQSMGCTIDADVQIGEGSPPVPESVRITGEVPEQLRKNLEALLEQELGISKENQQWMG